MSFDYTLPLEDIIVETNYRVYGYTSSTLKIAILGLFVNMQYRAHFYVIYFIGI